MSSALLLSRITKQIRNLEANYLLKGGQTPAYAASANSVPIKNKINRHFSKEN
jgi:hypothetical protein